MSKKTKTAVKPLSENTRKAIIITAIIVVAVVILSVALALILKPAQNTPSANDPGSTGSSSLTIRNGDFFYTSSDDTAYPKTAQNWSRYGYKAVQGSSHDFESLSTNENAVMGIVTTASDGDGDTWDTVTNDLASENITGVTNPGKHDDELADDNVYMIATKQATTASILSDSFSVSSGKSVKITVWLNTAQLKEGSKAVVMLQKSTVSAKAENWYAYNFDVGRSDATQDNGWTKLEFYIFNRESSTKYIRLSVGIGNVYSGEEGLDLLPGETEDAEKQPITGEGVLFVDDITYEEVTANDYRNVVDAENAEDSTAFKIIENEDIEDESKYLSWDVQNSGDNVDLYTTSEQFSASGEEYFPFTDRDDFYKKAENADNTTETEGEQSAKVASGFTIYKLSHKGETTDPIGFRLNVGEADIGVSKGEHGGIKTLYSLLQKDHHHISFWVRVDQVNKVSKVNIYVQSYNPDATTDDKWEDVKNGSWTAQVSNQEIDTDSNCGWIKYDVYIKPDAQLKEISILVTLGSKDGVYTQEQQENNLYPDGTLYVTSSAYEKISSKDYNNASSGTYAKKLDLIGDSATTSVTNGSFSTLNNTAVQPTGWTPAFAGSNILYRDGRGDEEISGITRLAKDVEGSQIQRGFDQNHGWDDEQNNVLLIKNNVATSYGYFSGEVTLSSRSIYVLSVLAKGEGAHFYLLNTDTTLERSERLLAEGKQSGNESSFGQPVATDELQNGWTRYYIVVVTGNDSKTVRVALFNGTLDGKQLNKGDVYFDQVQMRTLGSYSTADDPDWEEDQENKKYIVNWSMGSYKLNGEDLSVKDLLTKEQVELLVNVGALELETDEVAKDGELSALLKDSKNLPTEEDWNAMLTVPAEEESEENTEQEETVTREPVDLGLLFSVISSVALVAALLVVIVVKIFKNRRNQKKAA